MYFETVDWATSKPSITLATEGLLRDQWALRSQQCFSAAQAAGKFKGEIVPIEVPGRKGATIFDTDEHNRPKTTLEALAALKPAFRKDGTITAGNAPGVNSGAAAVVLADRLWAEARGFDPVARVESYDRRRRARHVRPRADPRRSPGARSRGLEAR
jgi:acetyl-CoA acetyltransferase